MFHSTQKQAEPLSHDSEFGLLFVVGALARRAETEPKRTDSGATLVQPPNAGGCSRGAGGRR
jgi:hypothetical protein